MGPGPARGGDALLSAYARSLIQTKARQLCCKNGFNRSDEADIEQDLTVALVQKLDRYDPLRNASRDTFATPADVLALLHEQVNAVRADPFVDPTERARTLGLLASLALRAMDSRDLAARLEAVERVLKLRKDAERDQKRRTGHGR